MKIENLYIAEVKKNDDMSNVSQARDVGGKIQIYVEEIMHGWKNKDLPWARPFVGGGSDSYGSIIVPEVGDKVWVFCEKEDLYKNWYYITGVSLKKTNIAQKILQFINTKLKIPTMPNGSGGLGLKGKYPDYKIIRFKNEITIGVNSKEKEVFIHHPSGSWIMINEDGDIQSKGKWKHYGELEVTKEVTAMSEIPAMKVTLSKHIHVSSVPGSPTAPPTPGN